MKVQFFQRFLTGKDTRFLYISGPSASRNIPPSSTIFEEESKNRLSQTRYQNKNQFNQDDYYNSGSINYRGYEHNQLNQTPQEEKTPKEIQQNEFQNNIKNFKEMQYSNAQTTQQEQTNANQYKTNQNENQQQQNQRNPNNEKNQYQTRRNYRQWRNERSYSRNSDTSSQKSRYSRSNSRSNSRYRRNPNQNNRKYNQNQRQYNNRNYQYKRQNQNNFQQRNNYQKDNQGQQSITKQMLQEQEIQQEQTCRYWKNGICKNHECVRKHYDMIKIMNLHYKPKSKRIKTNLTDQNILQKEIELQELNVTIETTRIMNINQIEEYLAKETQKLEQKEISNIKIRIAVKNNQKIKQEIQYIKNQFLLEFEKNKDTVNLTQAELIATNEIINQIKKEEFINLRQAFQEYNKEQEYENEKLREKIQIAIQQMKEQKNQKNREMEVKDYNVRISQIINTYKPNIQQFQQNYVKIGQEIQENTNISEEDKVNKQNTSSGEDQNLIQIEQKITTQHTENIKKIETNEKPIQQIKEKDKPINWGNLKVDSSYAEIQNKEGLFKESIMIIETAKMRQQIAFTKLQYKTYYKKYLTYQKIDTNKDTKEIPTGAYLILLIDANYINDIKSKILVDNDPNTIQIRIAAFAESISTHAIGTVHLTLESDKVKLNGSRQPITQAIFEIITSKKEYKTDEIHQIRTQINNSLNINVIIHLTFTVMDSKNKMMEIQNKDEGKQPELK